MVRLAALCLRGGADSADPEADAPPPRDLRGARRWLERAVERGSIPAHLALAKMFEESPAAEGADEGAAAAEVVSEIQCGGEQAGWAPRGGEEAAAVRDHPRAAEHYRVAADAGVADAQAALGYLHESGLGMEKDGAKAGELYRAAAERGHAKAQNNLGSLYFQGGGGLTKDEAQAVRWYRASAAQGNGSACNNLGICYEDGIGVEADAAKAEALYVRAARAGNINAQNNVAYIKVTAREYSEAERWFRRAAEQGSTDALHNLGGLAEHGLGMPVSLALAQSFYERAAAGGSEASAHAAEAVRAQIEAKEHSREISSGAQAKIDAAREEAQRAREDLAVAHATITKLEAAAGGVAASVATSATEKAELQKQLSMARGELAQQQTQSLRRQTSSASDGSGRSMNGTLAVAVSANGSAAPRGTVVRAQGERCKAFVRVALSADSRRRELLSRVIEQLSPDAKVELPDGSERVMNTTERKAAIKDSRRMLDALNEKFTLEAKRAVQVSESEAEDAKFLTQKLDDMVVKMFTRVLALEDQVRFTGGVPVVPPGSDIESEMRSCLGS